MEDSGREKIKITVNDHRVIYAQSGVSLLQALKKENIFVPSACGGRGMCGLCRVRVPEGAPAEFTPAELMRLNTEEQKNNIRLACQVKLHRAGGTVERDLRISIPESFFNARQYTAIVSELNDLTHDIREIRLQLQSPQTISFKSGQYVQFRIPPYAGHQRIVYRAYSIASPPLENASVELEVARVSRGIGTTYIFEHLKKGDTIIFNGPHGDFYLRDSDKPAIMIAGGSGMAPMKSMLADMLGRKIKRETRYFFGARAPSDVFHAGLMRSFERELPNFKFVPAVIKIPPGEKWDGEIGLIPNVAARRIADGFAGEVYLCGSPAMIEACLKILRQKKVSEDNVFYDKFA